MFYILPPILLEGNVINISNKPDDDAYINVASKLNFFRKVKIIGEVRENILMGG